jgi:hypothetical protein
MEFKNRVCPSCSASAATPAVVPSIDATGQSWTDLSAVWSGLFAEKSFFPYYRCSSCGLLYSPSYFYEDQLNELYKEMAPNMAEASSPEPLRRTQEGYFGIIADQVAAGGGYLELGPDIGTFARKCAGALDFSHFWLVEPNRAVWKELESGLPPARVDVADSPDLIDRIPDRSLSLAVAIHVLDHLVEPVEVLARIRPKMADDGVFLSVTHNEASLLAKVLKTRWPPYCLQHPQLYNPTSIGGIYRSAGFDVAKVVPTHNVFPLGFVIRQGLWTTVKLSLKNLGPLESISTRLRLGNIAAVAKPHVAT